MDRRPRGRAGGLLAATVGRRNPGHRRADARDVAGRGARAAETRRLRGGDRLRGRAGGRRHRQAVRALPLQRQAGPPGAGRARARGGGLGDDGAAVVGRRRAAHPPSRAARRGGRRRPDGVGRLPRPAHGARGLLGVAGRRALRGRPSLELRGLVRGQRARLRPVGAHRGRPRLRRRRGAGALPVDVGGRVVRQRADLAPAARGAGRLCRHGRLRAAGAAGPRQSARGRHAARMRIAVVGAGVGGLACGLRLARAGHDVVVLEQASAPGGKCGRLETEGFAFDTGASLVTMPWVLRDLLGDDTPELLRVEPVTRYSFADGTGFDLSADLPRAMEALEAWSPGAGADWVRFLGTCASMWRASVPFLTGPPPWPPSLRGAPPGDPRDFLRVKPWMTLRGLARRTAREPRLRMVIERFATYAGADPRRAPAALALAGYVEHAFGGWDLRGGIYELVAALVRRLEA